MKKYFLVLLIFIVSHQLHSQIIIRDGQCVGFGKFILGESITKFNVTAIPGGEYSKDGHQFKIYGYSGDRIEMLNIGFNTILLTFDDSDKLVFFSFLKFYRKNATPKYEKNAKKDYEEIIDHVTEQLNTKGTSKVYYKTRLVLDKGQEWAGTTNLLKVKKTSTAYQSTVEVSFSFRD